MSQHISRLTSPIAALPKPPLLKTLKYFNSYINLLLIKVSLLFDIYLKKEFY
jgi:hypothetical protein